MMLRLYVFVSIIYLSTFLDPVSCAGSSPILVNPNNPMIPRTQDFRECSAPTSCEGLYYCGNSKATCYLRECRDCSMSLRCNNFPNKYPGYTFVPACVEAYEVDITAAIVTFESPPQVMRSTADACDVTSQMVILNYGRSFKTVADIINANDPSSSSYAWVYTAYDIKLGFFYEANPDKPVEIVTSRFREQLLHDTATIVDATASTSSLGRPAAIFLNTSDWKITPATFAIQRCEDGTAVTGAEACPAADPALVAAAGTGSSKTTSQLLTIILPIIAGVAFIALIVAAVVIVRRRRANKVMRQTVQHTEPAVEVTMA